MAKILYLKKGDKLSSKKSRYIPHSVRYKWLSIALALTMAAETALLLVKYGLL